MKAYHWRNLLAERDRLARLKAGEPAPDAPEVKVSLPPRNVPPPLVVAPIPAPAPAQLHRAIVSLPVYTEGRVICVECRFYSRRDCINPRARHAVVGTYVEAASARKEKEGCGPKGRYWEPRMAIPRKPTEACESEPMEYVPPVPVRKLEPFIDAQVVDFWPIIRACRDCHSAFTD